MSAAGKTFDKKVLKRLVKLADPYKIPFIISGIFILVISYLAVYRVDLIGAAIDENVETGNAERLLEMTLLMIGLLLMETVFQYFQTLLANQVAQSVTIDLRKKLFSHVLRFKMSWFNNTPIGNTVTRVTSDIDTIAEVFSEGMLTIFGDILKLLFVIIWMFDLNWKLSLLTLIPIPLLLIATRVFQKSIKKSFQSVRVQVANLNAFVQEHVTGMHIVQLFGMEEKEMEKFRNINQKHRKAHIDSVMAYSIFFPVVEILAALSIAILIWYGAYETLEGHMRFGETVEFILLIYMLYRPIRMLADRFNILQMGMVGAERVFTLIDSENAIEDNGKLSPEKLEGEIRFREVHFSYKENNPVLKGISFDVKKGEKVAFVGATGAGKSSIINILTRLYEFQQGEILIDGKDIRSYKQESLHHHIGVVTQDVFLFSDTVLNNITLRDPSITRKMVEDAARFVGAHEFILQLPSAYDFEVNERGNSLSAGQRQLISFIRAYVYNPEILILDEATSSVDTESEILIQKAIAKITENRTSIIIAHRLSTIGNADKIIVLDKGKIVESGNHDSLVLQQGYYKRLFDLQFK